MFGHLSNFLELTDGVITKISQSEQSKMVPLAPEVFETKITSSLKQKPAKGNSHDSDSLDLHCLHRTEHSAHNLGSANAA